MVLGDGHETKQSHNAMSSHIAQVSTCSETLNTNNPWKTVSRKAKRTVNRIPEARPVQRSTTALSVPMSSKMARSVPTSREARPVPRNLNKRPQVVINKAPVSNKQIVPGNSSFAGAVKEGPKVALFSDSICNRMSKNELRQKLKCNITKKAFPGATTDNMYEHYMLPTLKKNTPDTAIIHIGVNDILAKGTPDGGLTSNAIEQIAQDVIKCGGVCKSAGVNNICISSILSFRGRKAQSTINHINSKLAKLCRDNQYDFILNDNIVYDADNTSYYGDGLHLNDIGRHILMDNFRVYVSKD